MPLAVLHKFTAAYDVYGPRSSSMPLATAGSGGRHPRKAQEACRGGVFVRHIMFTFAILSICARMHIIYNRLLALRCEVYS